MNVCLFRWATRCTSRAAHRSRTAFPSRRYTHMYTYIHTHPSPPPNQDCKSDLVHFAPHLPALSWHFIDLSCPWFGGPTGAGHGRARVAVAAVGAHGVPGPALLEVGHPALPPALPPHQGHDPHGLLPHRQPRRARYDTHLPQIPYPIRDRTLRTRLKDVLWSRLSPSLKLGIIMSFFLALALQA